jgi:type I restriction enzyme R subunit
MTMSGRMKEAELEEKFIQDLCNLNYERVNVTNLDALLKNMKVQLSKLNNYEFSDEEFNALYKNMLSQKSVFDKAVFLRSMTTIKLDDGTVKEIVFLNKKDWCKNIFQVTNQFQMKQDSDNRYDVSILINGIPMVHIELKSHTVDYISAVNQIDRYKRESMSSSIFDYIQVFVVSNGHTTKYFANNKKVDTNYMFEYADHYNKKISLLSEFVNVFLEPCQIGKYISRYMIMSNDDNHKIILAMRSYQVHAVEGILRKMDGNVKNGYIWHTTGSGKTLTSFKACEIISEREDVDKVIFIVDRTDLDRQTVSEYQKFRSQEYFKGGVCDINAFNSTREFTNAYHKSENKILVTTMQKLDKAIKSDKLMSGQNVVLVFDECHRSQLGESHALIEKFFDYPFKFGFTGTPILAENAKDGSDEFKTTEDVFGQAVHKYLINDAIDDKNVLGFSVDYKKVFKFKDSVEDQLVEGINTKEVYTSMQYIKALCDDVITNYDRFTSNRDFNAMLATSGIPSAIKCYKYINGIEIVENGVVYKCEIDHGLKIATVFTVDDNESFSDEGELTKRLELGEIMKRYNQDFDDGFSSTNYDLTTQGAYKANVAKRVKNRDIDLLIVSDMFLTGFDAKKLNTLFFDKDQKYHNLIQSLSRTNRIFKGKDYGNVVCYRPKMSQQIDEALALFSNPDSTTSVLKGSYQVILKELNEAMSKLLIDYPSVDSINQLKGDEAKLEFVKAMREVNRAYNSIITFRDFKEEDINGMSRQDIEEYQVKYKELIPRSTNTGDSILNDIDFEVSLIKSIKVNYDYIKNLLSQLDDIEDETEVKERINHIIKQMEKDPKLQSKIELIKDFLENNYRYEYSLTVQFDDYINEVNTKKMEEFASDNDLSVEKMKLLISEYEYHKDQNNGDYNDVLQRVVEGKKLKEKRALRTIVSDFVTGLFEDYL